MRGVAVACKLGEMANMYQLAEEEEERWLVWAVEELLRVVQDQRGETPVTRDTHGSGSESTLADLELPGWVSRTDLGAPIEALATFYARSGKLE